jgi:uncharacterized protein
MLLLSAVFAVLLEALRLPAALLLGPMIAAILVAAVEGSLRVPRLPFYVSQAVIGCMIARSITPEIVSTMIQDWPLFLAAVFSVIAASSVIGLLLTRWRVLPGTTAVWGSSPGAASAMTLMAESFGADVRLVAFMQYLRVLVIVVLTPLIVSLAFGFDSGSGTDPATREPVLGSPVGWAFSLTVAAAGMVAGRRLRIPAGSLLVPLVIAAAVTLTGVLPDAAVPPLLRETAFALIGMQVGLRFTPDTIRTAGRLLAPVIASILAMIAACFGLAWVLSVTAGVTLLDGYLATTPGGLYAVLATAFGVRADTTFVLAVQALRLFVMLLAAPPLVRRLVRRPARRTTTRAR